MKTLALIVTLLALAMPSQADATTRTIITTSPLAPMTVTYGAFTATALPAIGQVDPTAPAMTASWTTEDGMEWGVITPKKVGESIGNQAWRHNAAVKALVNEVGGPAETPKGT